MGQKQMALKTSNKKMSAIHAHLYFKWQTGVFEGKGKIKDAPDTFALDRLRSCKSIVTFWSCISVQKGLQIFFFFF